MSFVSFVSFSAVAFRVIPVAGDKTQSYNVVTGKKMIYHLCDFGVMILMTTKVAPSSVEPFPLGYQIDSSAH